jgi:SPP1 family phage portal protein
MLCSDRVNDKEALVDALLVIYGFGLTDEQIRQSREQRVISAPKKTEGAEVTYVTKELNEEQLEVLKKAIVDDIHKISMTPNMTDENFVGNSSGVAINFKLFPFRINIQDKEAPFELGLMERIRIYNNYLVKTKQSTTTLPIHNIDAVFKRSLPQNDYETSQMIVNLMGKVSDETLISQLSYIQDASAELEKRKNEIIEAMQGNTTNYGTDNANDDEDVEKDQETTEEV